MIVNFLNKKSSAVSLMINFELNFKVENKTHCSNFFELTILTEFCLFF